MMIPGNKYNCQTMLGCRCLIFKDNSVKKEAELCLKYLGSYHPLLYLLQFLE